MTDVTFYVLESTSPEARLQTVCRLVEKAVQHRHLVHIQAGSQGEAEAIDELLWAFRPESFIPHNLITEGPTPPPAVRIGWPDHAATSRDLLINLADPIPSFASEFRRILEVVGGGDELREPSRRRWKQYRQQDHNVSSHQLP